MQTFNFIQYADQYSICRPPFPFFLKLGDDFTTNNNKVDFDILQLVIGFPMSTTNSNKNFY